MSALAVVDARGRLAARWQSLIDEYLIGLAAAGRPASSVGLPYVRFLGVTV